VPPLLPNTTEHFVDLPGLRMHYAAAGPEDGFPVILLHGFPEFWYSWRFQIPVLADAGYRVIAPDQRGYNLTDKQGPYDADTLMQDLINLQDHLGMPKMHLIAHDWGSVIAWAFVSEHPDRVVKHVNMNGPHPNAYTDVLKVAPSQILKSWYVYFFQLPGLPEGVIKAGGMKALEIAMKEVPSEYMSAEDIDYYKEALRQPGALSAMIGWYRSVPKQVFRMRREGREYTTDVPTLVIFGERDHYLHKKANELLPKYVSDLRVEYLPDATHWVQMHEPDTVNRLTLDFLSQE